MTGLRMRFVGGWLAASSMIVACGARTGLPELTRRGGVVKNSSRGKRIASARVAPVKETYMSIIRSISALVTVVAVAIPSVASADPIRDHREHTQVVRHDHDRGDRRDHRWEEHRRWEREHSRHDHGRRR
jgi:hypothetical protein